ncbi:hypothetical protein ACQP1W_02585 [Spirillospora sp. CA-255316]
MIKLTFPDLPRRELTLDSIDPVRGEPYPNGDGPPPLEGRVFLGGPHSRQVTPEFVADDPELSAYVERESEHHTYHLVFMNLSFAVEPVSPRLASATLDLRLSATVPTPEPVALSMTPRRITDSAQVQRGFRLGPQLMLMEVEASLGSIERTTVREEHELFLQALRLLRPDPAWEFRRTKSMNLEGAHDLVMVVRTARNTAAGVTCTVTASTKAHMRRWYRRELPDPLQLGAAL